MHFCSIRPKGVSLQPLYMTMNLNRDFNRPGNKQNIVEIDNDVVIEQPVNSAHNSPSLISYASSLSGSNKQQPATSVSDPPSPAAYYLSLTASDKRARNKANRLRRESPLPCSDTTTTTKPQPVQLPPAIDISPPIYRRRRAHRETMSRYPDINQEALAGTIERVRRIVEYAYFSGGAHLKLQAGDEAVESNEYAGLKGCSRYASKAIISPIKSVLETLKVVERGLENWARRGKRMAQQQGALGTYHPLLANRHDV